MDNGLQNGYLFCEDEMLKRLFDWLDKKRLADWFEKISAAFAVGAVLSETNAIISVALSIMCLAFSQALAKRGVIMGVWLLGAFCTIFGLTAIYAAKKGWLK